MKQGVTPSGSGHSAEPEPSVPLSPPEASVPNAVEIVKNYLRLGAVHICWPQPGVLDAIRAAQAAKEAVVALPPLTVSSYPVYPSVDDDQSGIILAAHLTAEQMVGVPLHIAKEVLDSLAQSAAGVRDGCDEHRREACLSAYGPALAELVCDAIDEALESRTENYRRLSDWDATVFAPLDSTEIDEPRYNLCGPDDEHASPATEFDFYDAIEAARELIEKRDKAASAIRRGDPAQGTEVQRAETATEIGGSVHDGPVRDSECAQECWNETIEIEERVG